jgi:hypothetical protein
MSIILLISCASTSKQCYQYDEIFNKCKSCEIISINIDEDFKPLSNNSPVVMLKEDDLSNYKKIGELYIVCNIDLSEINRGWENNLLLVAMDFTSKQLIEINKKIKIMNQELTLKLNSSLQEHGCSYAYLAGVKTEPEANYSLELKIKSGCNFYVFHKYELYDKK